ncbi:Arylesterase [Dictyocaulus viviparus]|uniref:Arylesterase n=1 Tax=Dictyocaulus viviparus TaxID=29172 RepID=A0A0D8XEG5_DICVI|nr:Arylesterase [Dictyocaulus viviparus]
MELIREIGLVFISTGLAMAYGNRTARPTLAVLPLKKEMTKYETMSIKIEGDKFNPSNSTALQDEFIPLGLSSYYTKRRISLYVINKHNIKKHLSIYDVVAIGADRFFVSNLAYMARGTLQTVELVMQSSFGALYFFDGRTVTLHESRLSTPSALAIDQKRELIFIASLINEIGFHTTQPATNSQTIVSKPQSHWINSGRDG